MSKRRIIQYCWSTEVKSLILFWHLLWITLTKEVNDTVYGYALTITIIGFNITLKIGKNQKGILKSYGLS